MNAQPEVHRQLLLEALETRTLLAVDVSDPFGLAADFDLAMHAISGSGAFQGSFSTNFGNHQLVLTGSSNSSINIDLTQLPSFITNLKISSFGSVTMSGTDHLDTLILSNIQSVSAPNLSVTEGFLSTNVASLSLWSLPPTTKTPLFRGSDMDLTVHTLDNTTIFSDLHSLTLTSDSKTILFSSLNPDQTLNLTYLPESLGLFGISRSSVHVVLPPVDTGHSTPDTPPTDITPGTDPSQPVGGTTVPDPATPDPTQLVIISLPLDERTRAFLDQLRTLLNSSQDDQRVLDFLNHTSHLTEHSANTVMAEGLAEQEARSFFALPLSALGPDNSINLSVGHSESNKAVERLFAEYNFGVEQSRFLSQPLELVPANLADGLPPLGGIDIDVTWPVAFATATASEPLHPSNSRKFDDGEIAPRSVADGVRALGTYLVERMSAEFSPGQQSLVLLVDPQPSRGVGTNRKSSIERLTAGLGFPIPDRAIAVV